MAGKRVAVTGGTGFIGRKIVRRLVERGDSVTILSRRAPGGSSLPAGVRVARYEPLVQGPWFDELAGVDAVIHLAGEPVVGVRWTESKKREFEQSRIESSRMIARAIARAPEIGRPRVLVGASAVGYYGLHGAEDVLDETCAPGADFLAQLTAAWEAAQAEVTIHGVRAAHVRIGLVLGADGGVLSRMMLPFRLGVGGPIGSGEQILSWVHEEDLIALFLFALDDERVRGPIDGTAPSPVSMNEFACTLGTVLGRPSFFRVPSFALRLAFGEGADPILGGQRVLPKLAERLGFGFRHTELREALESLLGKR